MYLCVDICIYKHKVLLNTAGVTVAGIYLNLWLFWQRMSSMDTNATSELFSRISV